jgi:hypothetical protein
MITSPRADDAANINKSLAHHSAHAFLSTRTCVASRRYVAAVTATLVRLPVYRTFSLRQHHYYLLTCLVSLSPLILLTINPVSILCDYTS